MSSKRITKMKNIASMFFILNLAVLYSAAFAAPSISLSTDNTSPMVGQNFTVTVNLSGAAPFSNWAQYIKFDKTKVQLAAQPTGQTAGTYATFVKDGRALADINASGEIRAAGFGLADNAGGAGTLGVFTFSAVATGAITITTENKSVSIPFGNVLKPMSGSDVLPAIAGGLSINIQPFTSAPVITVHPSNQTVTAGNTAVFSVTATGSSISYQWQKNTVNISGAVSASYTTPATVTGDNGASYRCVVSNIGGSVTSNAATLTVNPPAPVINSVLTATGKAGAAFSYTITASNTPTSFSATGLPAGLSLNTSTGAITGTPSTAVTSAAVTINALNAGGTGTAQLTVTIYPANYLGDVNGDKLVNVEDLFMITGHYGQNAGLPAWDIRADVNNDGIVNDDDLTMIVSNFGKNYN